jgi:hypothetical protein
MPWDSIVYYFTGAITCIAVPFWFIFVSGLRLTSKWITRRSVGRGILLSTVIMWPLMLLVRVYVEVPYMMARTEDPMYDGMAGNAGLLILGWLFALVLQIPHIILRLLLDLYQGRRNDVNQGEPGASSEPSAPEKSFGNGTHRHGSEERQSHVGRPDISTRAVAALWFAGIFLVIALLPFAIIGESWGVVWFYLTAPLSFVADRFIVIGSESTLLVFFVSLACALGWGMIAICACTFLTRPSRGRTP